MTYCTSVVSSKLKKIDVNMQQFLFVCTAIIVSAEYSLRPIVAEYIKSNFISACCHQSQFVWPDAKMKVFILSLFSLAFFQLCSGHQTSLVSALRNAVLEGYEKDAKPDGKVEVKSGMDVIDFDLCAHKEVNAASINKN